MASAKSVMRVQSFRQGPHPRHAHLSLPDERLEVSRRDPDRLTIRIGVVGSESSAFLVALPLDAGAPASKAEGPGADRHDRTVTLFHARW